MKKDLNPKDAYGVKKASMSAIPAPVLLELGIAMQEGAAKYGRHNFRSSAIMASVYYDACMRHMMAWWEGENIDPPSGLSHITKAIATLVVLRDAMMQDQFRDDRPPKSPPGWLEDLNLKSENLYNLYPTPVLPHTEVDKTWVET
jgi:hypothetical protein